MKNFKRPNYNFLFLLSFLQEKLLKIKARSLRSIFSFFLLFTFFNTASAQLVAIVGLNVATGDGISFVALQPIPAGTIIYFTEREHVGGGVFNGALAIDHEGLWSWTAPAGGIAVGQVVQMTETGTSTNTFSVSCSSGACGTVNVLAIPISLSSTNEVVYAYSDTDNNPSNGVTEIYSAIYSDVSPTTGLNGDVLPTTFSSTCLIMDGFPTTKHEQYKVSLRSNPTSLSNLQNPTNYDQLAGNVALSTVPFNISLGGTDPELSVAVSPSSVAEDGASNLVYTFTLASNAASDISVNFSITGTANGSDYTTSGSVTILSGQSTASLTVNPTTDTNLETAETVIVTLDPGTGYAIGNPSVATGTIDNDDSVASCPLVAVSGVSHASSATDFDGFSFVVLDDLTSPFSSYFTELEYDNTTLAFKSSLGDETVFRWDAPASISRGEVVVVTETGQSTNMFNVSCNSASCGTITLISGSFSVSTGGVSFFSYADTDANPLNGVTEVYSVLYTGESFSSGGTIPLTENPSTVYADAVVVDGFSATPPDRTEYNQALRGVSVDESNFTNTGNWIHAGANPPNLSATPFTDITIKTGPTVPDVSVTVAPGSVLEDGVLDLVYTFTLSQIATSDISVNFNVGGSATFSTDHISSGSPGIGFTYGASSGTITIASGTNSSTVTIDPTSDTDLEPYETIALSLASGTGYGPGSPNAATGTIVNDDILSTDCPLVAVIGLNHGTTTLPTDDGFSFVALQDIPSGTKVHFTEEEFDNTTLLFEAGGGESVFSWTAPTGVNTGDVFHVDEPSSSSFTIDCTDGSGSGTCGTIVLESGSFAASSSGESFYAYADTDNDPSNGVTEIYAVMFTGLSVLSPGGPIPVAFDPTAAYSSAIVVDGFPTSAPNRTEYDPTGRGVTLDQADLETPGNYLHAQGNAGLSTTAFTDIQVCLSLTITCPPDPAVIEGCTTANVQPTSGLIYSTNSVLISETDFTNEGGTITTTGTTITASYQDVATAIGVQPIVVTRTFTVTVDGVLIQTCDQTFTIQDAINPVAICQNITAYLDGSGNSTIVAPDLDGGSSDNCGSVSFSASQTSFTCADLGANNITLTGTDGSSNSATCTATVTVNDSIPPSLVCQDITVTLDAVGSGSANVFITGALVSQSDNCSTVGGVGVTGPNIFNCSNVGTMTRTISQDDPSGNVTTCTFVTTIIDTIPPVAVSQNITAFLDGAGNATITGSAVDGGSSDNCGIASLSASQTAFSCADIGPNTVILTAEDGSSNTSSATGTVTVIDSTSPTAFFQNIFVFLDGAGTASITPSDVDGGSSDNCGSVSLSASQTTFSCADIGPNTVTLTAEDGSNNTSSATGTVTVNDSIPPTAIFQNISVFLNGAGMATITGSAVDGGSSDNCGIVSLSASQTTFTCADLGSNTVILTAEDGSSNTSSATGTVTVNDSIPPIISCPPNLTIEFGDAEDASVTGEPTTVDNCDPDPLTFLTDNVILTGTCPVVKIIERTWTSTDVSGNPGISCLQIISVRDSVPPVLVCPADVSILQGDSVQPPHTGVATATDLFDPTPVISWTDAPSGPGPCIGSIAIPRTWTATDACGNSSSCVQLIIINDITPPVITCPGTITINLDPWQCCDILTYVVTATDDSGGPVTIVLTAGYPSFACFPGGTTTNTFVATDPCGNTASCSFDVIVTGLDTDGDGTLDCDDACPLDPLKTSIGVCGCGNPEPGTACDDGNPLTVNDVIQNYCACEGVLFTPDQVNIIDPCSCLNNATTGDNGQFSEVVEVEAPAGQTWTIVSSTGLYLPTSPDPPAAPIPFNVGDALTFNAGTGNYELLGIHVDGQGYSIVVTNGTDVLGTSNLCYYPEITFDIGAYISFADLPTAASAFTEVINAASGDPALGSGTFLLFDSNGDPVPIVGDELPATLNSGELYTLVYEFTEDGQPIVPPGPNTPGCAQEIVTQFLILSVGCE